MKKLTFIIIAMLVTLFMGACSSTNQELVSMPQIDSTEVNSDTTSSTDSTLINNVVNVDSI